MINIIMIVVGVLWILFGFIVFHYAARYVYSYKIRESCIEIVLFGKIPLMRLHFNNIVEIKKTSFKEILVVKSVEMFMALRLGNRILGEVVLVRQKKGLIRAIIITPDNADKFIQEVLQRLPE